MLIRFDPFRDFDRLAGEFAGTGARSMPLDAYRKGEHYVVHVDLPGVDPDSIDLTVEKNTLTLEAVRRWERAEDETVLMSERPQGTFRRQLFLGDGLDTNQIEADYDHGVLTLRIPVAEAAKPRKVAIGGINRELVS